MAMKRFECRKCHHEVHANSRPEPIRWTDGHVCHFWELPPEVTLCEICDHPKHTSICNVVDTDAPAGCVCEYVGTAR